MTDEPLVVTARSSSGAGPVYSPEPATLLLHSRVVGARDCRQTRMTACQCQEIRTRALNVLEIISSGSISRTQGLEFLGSCTSWKLSARVLYLEPRVWSFWDPARAGNYQLGFYI